ncbi:MAG: hypothetical protein KDC12_10435 [Flavobacteriales bacterium]|nr:hypothetical protein [Flavobacteriales bacterium]
MQHNDQLTYTHIASHAAGVYAVCRGPEQHQVFSAGADRFVALWDIEEAEQLPFSVRLEHAAYAVHYSPSHCLLLAGNSRGHIHVIDFENRSERALIEFHGKGVFRFLELCTQDILLSVGGEGNMALWRLPEMQLVRQIPIGNHALRGLSVNADETLIALGCGDGSVRVFETTFFNEVYTWNGHSGTVNCTAFHPTKPVVLSGGKDGHLRMWSLTDDREILSIEAHNYALYDLAFSMDGSLCATASFDKTVKLWNASTFDKPIRLNHPPRTAARSFNTLCWTAERKLVYSGDNKVISICNTEYYKL